MVRRLILLLAVIAAGVVLWGYRSYEAFLSRPLEIGSVEVINVRPGAVFGNLWPQWVDRGWSDSRWQWRILGRVAPEASRIQAGEFAIEPGTTPRQLLHQLANGRVMLHAIQFIEGQTMAQAMATIWEHPAFTRKLPETDPESALLESLDSGLPGIEGLVLPDTYHFPRGTTDVEIIRRGYAALQELLDQAWEERLPDLPYGSPYEALIMASIVEKETAVESERGLIAGVFVHRLRRKMRLQTDPTVIYGLGEAFDGNIRRVDLRTDTPYNTYTRHGLPPTPIALASAAAILSALQPVDTDMLYFVSRGDGSHQFSATLAEHEAAVNRYIRNRP